MIIFLLKEIEVNNEKGVLTTSSFQITFGITPQSEQVVVVKFKVDITLHAEYSFKSRIELTDQDKSVESPRDNLLQPLTFNDVQEVVNIKAKDRKLMLTNFKLGIDSRDSAVSVLPFEGKVSN